MHSFVKTGHALSIFYRTTTMPRKQAKPKTITTTIEKLIFGGQGIGRVEKTNENNAHLIGKTIFVWNALPGETVDVLVTKRKKDWMEGIAQNIHNPSPDRISPLEGHFLACSPWQIMTYEAELEWKKKISLETFQKIGKLTLTKELDITTIDPDSPFEASRSTPPTPNKKDNSCNSYNSWTIAYHYRNKIEYSFALDDDGQNRLAFFVRGSKGRNPIDPCLLAAPQINRAAQTILAWINGQDIPTYYLKSLILRSDGEGHVIAALFINAELPLKIYPELNDTLLGFHLFYTHPHCPAARPDKLLYSNGQNYLSTNIAQERAADSPVCQTDTLDIETSLAKKDLELKNQNSCNPCNPPARRSLGEGGWNLIKTSKLKFGLLSFFQVNLPIFRLALVDIARFLDPNKDAIDFYSGVGAISLPLHDCYKSCTLVDNNEEAISYAKQNIEENNIANCKAVLSPAESITELITSDKVIIFDPPRAGLHPDVVIKVLQKEPPRLVYLSCNISTQARDIELLREKYEVEYLRLYDFFPRTPHIESLCVLEKNNT